LTHERRDIKKATNSLHLSRRQAIAIANYKAFVPDLPFNRSSFWVRACAASGQRC
jgi:hypothetical protein